MKRQTSSDRIACAVVTGSLVGGALVGVWLLANAAMLTVAETLSGWFGILPLAIVISFFSVIPFSVGIIFLGLPVWAFLHWRGWNGPVAAMSAGAVLTFAGAGVLAVGLGLVGRELALFAIAGAIVGWTIQRTAYGPIKPLPPPPAPPS